MRYSWNGQYQDLISSRQYGRSRHTAREFLYY